jgi:hypothetical protein
MTKSKTWLLRIAIALVVVGGGYFAWQRTDFCLPKGGRARSGRARDIHFA